MLQVSLHPGLPNGRFAHVRPLCGLDEMSVRDQSDLAATSLLDRLLVSTPGTSVGPGSAWELAISDRDRLLATVYRHHFGERIEGTISCDACSEAFEFSHTVDDLLNYLTPPELKLATGPDDDGVFESQEKRRFRLPTPQDQRSVLGLSLDEACAEILNRCIVDGVAGVDTEDVEAAMAEAGPMLDFEMEARCPECANSQSVHFDIREHLFGALASERPWLTREIHAVARAYGWGLNEILSLSREQRRAFVGLIDAERVMAVEARR